MYYTYIHKQVYTYIYIQLNIVMAYFISYLYAKQTYKKHSKHKVPERLK